MIRIVYRAPWICSPPDDAALPRPSMGDVAAYRAIETRGYLQGRADTLADLLAFAGELAGAPDITADELAEWAELGRRVRAAAHRRPYVCRG